MRRPRRRRAAGRAAPSPARASASRSAAPRARSTRAKRDVLELADVGELVVGGEPCVVRPALAGVEVAPLELRPGPARRVDRSDAAARSRCRSGHRPRSRRSSAPSRSPWACAERGRWRPASGRGAAGGPAARRARRWSARWSAAASRSLRSISTSLSPTCMSAAPRRPGVLGGDAGARTRRCAARRARRPWASWMSARASEHAHDVGEVAAGLEAGDRLGVAVAGVVEVAAAPVGEAEQRRGRAALEVVVGRRPGRSTRLACVDRPVEVAGEEGEAGPVDRDHRREAAVRRRRRTRSARRSRSSQRLDELEQRLDAGRVAGGHAGARRGSSASTGRSAKTSAGRASSQLRSCASWRARCIAGAASSISSAARSGSSPARAWAIASSRLAVVGVPVARPAVQLGDPVGLLVEQPGPEDVAEEVVVAVPGAAVVERDEEQVRPVELARGSPWRRRGR